MTDEPPIPSRQALDRATAMNDELGHENLGFLSEASGFLPRQPPLLSLPESHRAWDDLAPRLPELHRTLQLRPVLDAMPLLDASEEALPERYLCRASALLSFFAHAYVRVRNTPPDGLPASIEQPWEEVARRLGRPAPFMSYIDLIVYNWKLRDPQRADPMRVENLDLLIPSVGNPEERVFHLAQVELVAQGSPLVGQTVRAQEAALRGDVASLKRELLSILDCLRELTEVSYLKVDPNPYSATFVDQAVWAKTVAPFALPIREGTQGNAGSASPVFPLMDEFLSRSQYDSTLGRESAHLRAWFPPHWQEFFAAIGQVSVRAFVEASGDRSLQGLFQAVLDAYAGDKGFLGVHRLKAYGFLRIAFKAGRTVTIGAFGDRFKEQAWDRINAELDETRMERYAGVRQHRPFSEPRRQAQDGGDAESNSLTRLRLDVAGAGVYYRPGDRLALYAENSDELIDRTLRALRASGEEMVRLNRDWLDALRDRFVTDPAPSLALSDLLRLGAIRPVSRETARALSALTASSALRAIVDARAEDQWELWDLLDLLYDSGFETRRLWKAEPWEAESVCNLVPPAQPRLYSIASTMEPGAFDGAATLDLGVASLAYQTRDTRVSRAARRHGMASSFARRVASRQIGGSQPIPIQVVPASRFHLPADPATPIVMFAAGAGISPFRGFLQERLRQAGGGENWLFFGTRSPEQLHFHEELRQMVGAGRLTLRVAFSAADVALRFDPSVPGGAFALDAGARGRIDALLEDEGTARAVWDLIRPIEDGGRGAHIYVCGRTQFAATIERCLRAIIARFSEALDGEPDARVTHAFERLVADGRYKQDVFTTYLGSVSEHERQIDISDIVRRNNDRNGYWIVVSGRVYDVTGFMLLHPGGHRLIIENAGTDASHAYRAVQHHRNSEIDAMLGMYEIGAVRRLRFGNEWGVAIGPTGLRYVSLADLFRAWARFAYLVVDMENALTNDFSTLRRAATLGEDPDEMTPMKAQMIADTHRRFTRNQLATVTGESLDELWALTTGPCGPAEDVYRLRREHDALAASADAVLVHQLGDDMDELLETLLRGDDEHVWDALRQLGNLVYREDRRYLSSVKSALRQGLQVFEAHEARAVRAGSDQLVACLTRLPAVTADYYARLATGARAILDPALPGRVAGAAVVASQVSSPPAPFLGHGVVVDTDALAGAQARAGQRRSGEP